MINAHDVKYSNIVNTLSRTLLFFHFWFLPLMYSLNFIFASLTRTNSKWKTMRKKTSIICPLKIHVIDENWHNVQFSRCKAVALNKKISTTLGSCLSFTFTTSQLVQYYQNQTFFMLSWNIIKLSERPIFLILQRPLHGSTATARAKIRI